MTINQLFQTNYSEIAKTKCHPLDKGGSAVNLRNNPNFFILCVLIHTDNKSVFVIVLTKILEICVECFYATSYAIAILGEQTNGGLLR